MPKLLWKLLLAASCCARPSMTAGADWPQDRFDAAHSAASPASLPGDLDILWKLDLPQTRRAWPDQPRMDFDECYHPVVVGGLVIVGSPADDSVTAYRLGDGSRQWRFLTGGPVRLSPASDGTRVFIGSDDGWLYALSADRGQLLWKFKGGPQSRMLLGNGRLIDTWCVRGGPVVANGRVWFAAGIWPFMGVFLHCLDAATGKPMWSNSGEGAEYMVQPHGAMSFGGIAPQGTLTVSGDRLLVPGGRTLPGCYDRRTGKRQYYVLATKTGDHAVAANDRYYYCGGAAYDLATGKDAGPALGSPVLDGGKLYGFTSGGIGVVDMAAPVQVEAKPVPRGGSESKGKSKGDSKTVVSRRPRVDAMSPLREGTVLIKAGKRLYAGGKGKVAALDLPLADGKDAAWQISVEGAVGALAAADDHLIVVTDRGRIYCLGAKDRVEKEVRSRGRISAAAASSTLPRPAGPIERAKAILTDSATEAGYVLVLGAESGELARGLAARPGLSVVVLEPDPAKVQTLREELHDAGQYGDPLSVLAGDIESSSLPPYFASLIVAENDTVLPSDPGACARLFRVLHPYHGKAYLNLNAKQRQALAEFATGEIEGKATVDRAVGLVRLSRSGGLPGAGNWTHEHGDAANTRVSSDRRVKAPLGLLWFGGSSHDSILPRHGHGPQPQVLDGRLVIEQVDGLRSVDIYTGRVLWEATIPGMGSYYNNTSHQYGANAAGTNYISTPDTIYVRYGRECLRLDPATGKRLPSISLPKELSGSSVGKNLIWGYLSVTRDYLVGGAAVPDKQRSRFLRPTLEAGERFSWGLSGDAVAAKEVPQAIESQSLFVMDRRTGEVLWSTAARGRFRHNAICAGAGKLFAIDRPPVATARGAGGAQPATSRLLAFDLATGKTLWCQEQKVFGTWLSCAVEQGVVIESGDCARDTLPDEPRGMRAYRASDGRELWYDAKALGPPLVRGDWVVRSQGACGALDGKPVQVSDPLTGVPREWTWTRAYGCNTPAGSQHLLTFRSGAAGFYDLARCGGTGNWGGFRSSCSNNLIVAGGLITVPDYTRTCTCSYQNQTSVALLPDPDAEMWTYQGTSVEPRRPLRRLGVNFGAPGNRLDDHGTLWLEYPRIVDVPAKAAGKGAAAGWAPLQITPAPAKMEFFRQHSSAVSGPLPWICASGVKGIESVRVTVGSGRAPAGLYTVRLCFIEPEDLKPGDRVFTVWLQGEEVLSSFDVVQEAGGSRRGIIKQFSGIRAGDELVLVLKPFGKRPAIISGLEIVAE